MEPWVAIVIIVVTNLLIFGSSYVITRMQLKHSTEQLDREHQRILRADRTERTREVRGEPLLGLRDELARMAGKMEALTAYAHMGRTDREQSESDRVVEEKMTNELLNYHLSGDWLHAVYQIDDIEIMDMAEKIERDYVERMCIRTFSDESDVKQLMQVAELRQENKGRIAAIQSEINKRLEEL